MKKPAISVIVPVYNAEKYLRECLESVQKQSFGDFEVVCVNDGSTDDSLKILEEFAASDDRFKVISQKNKGVNAARSAGYRKAIGKYIAWVDADDFIDEKMYDNLYRLAERESADVAICNYNFYPANVSRKEKWYIPYRGVKDWKFVSRNTIQWNKIVRKELLDKLEICDLFEKIGEGCYSIVLVSANKIVTTDAKLYHYRVGHDSLSGNYKNMKWYNDTVRRAIKKYEYSKEHDLPEEFQDFYEYVVLYYYLILMAIAAKNCEKGAYRTAKENVRNGRLFAGKSRNFFEKDLPFVKRLFLRICIYPNYYVAKIAAKVVLR